MLEESSHLLFHRFAVRAESAFINGRPFPSQRDEERRLCRAGFGESLNRLNVKSAGVGIPNQQQSSARMPEIAKIPVGNFREPGVRRRLQVIRSARCLCDHGLANVLGEIRCEISRLAGLEAGALCSVTA